MNVVQKGILTLIRSAITGQALVLPEGFCLSDAEELIISHQIVGLVYEGALQCGISKTEPIMSRLFQLYCQVIFRSNAQMKEVDKLLMEFEKAGIDYMPVKGCSLKSFYPQPAMRVMTDADILIRMEQYHVIRLIMKSLGYRKKQEEDHEIVWSGKAVELELHKRLVPVADQDYYSYMGDGWQRARHHSGYRYELTPEDMFIFLLVHFAKHYRGGGIGLRQAVDLWVYMRQYPELDWDYIHGELEKLQMVEFWDNVRHLLCVWFETAEPTAKTEFISRFIFDSGSWGEEGRRDLYTRYQYIKQTGSMEAGRRIQIFRAVFPDCYTMQHQYPILKKNPWLLPIMWPVRWVKVLLFRRDRIYVHMHQSDEEEIRKIQTLEQSLEYVGLS